MDYHVTNMELPEGSWYCPDCICEICGHVVKLTDSSSFFVGLGCRQCEHKYHEKCIKGKVSCNGDVDSDTWFCRGSCQKIYMGLRSRVGIMNCIGDGFCWTILRCNHGDQKVHSSQKIALMAECHAKLAVALTIMEDCFLPMVDPKTGIHMIPHVLYNWGSHFMRLNYRGFYTIVLEKDDEIISVASIRVHGVVVAEMPLIATCRERRRQGMCRRLMGAIEEMLKSFNVKMLVLSAIPDLVDTWTSGFGFKPMENDEKMQLSNISLMSLPGTILLKKGLYEGSKGNGTDLFSSKDQSQKCGGFDINAFSETEQQSMEHVRTVPEAESLLHMSPPMNKQLDGHQRELHFFTSKSPLSTAIGYDHGDASNEVSCNMIGNSNPCEINEFLSTEQAVPHQKSATHSNSSLPFYVATDNGLPTDPGSSFTTLIRNMDRAHDSQRAANARNKEIANCHSDIDPKSASETAK